MRVETTLGAELPFTRHDPPADFHIQQHAEQFILLFEQLGLKPMDTMGAHHGMIAIARGHAQVLLYHMASFHDFGIPQVIVEEVGGICTDLDGNPVSYDDE